MGWGMAAAAAIPVIASLYGQEQAKGDKEEARKARQAALAQFANLNIPDIEKQKLLLAQYQSAGEYNPELEQLFRMDPTAMGQIAVDPRLKASQMAALEQVAQIANTGMSDADRASLELIRRQVAGEAQAKQEQIMQNMQARGQGGSGAELIARLQAGQSSADRMNQQALEEARMMQQARMQALANQANISSGIRGQEYGEQSDLARARDTINQFNVANQQGLAGRNVERGNTGQQMNLQNRQNLMNANTGLSNQEQAANKALLQQQFQNQMNLATSRSNALTGNATALEKTAADTAGMWGQIGQGAGGGIASFTAYQNDQNKPILVPAGGRLVYPNKQG